MILIVCSLFQILQAESTFTTRENDFILSPIYFLLRILTGILVVLQWIYTVE